ncbi:hypothetical protein MKEN_00541500 [Mycena kentingensis (nom. inval.)]|nr:hypothetical protein MKEN_00541500 [Mycena kentingensis (nom. inval.)]
MQRRIPTELEDTVIDFCHFDAKTLVNCGLVCRSWVPASRYHLISEGMSEPKVEKMKDVANKILGSGLFLRDRSRARRSTKTWVAESGRSPSPKCACSHPRSSVPFYSASPSSNLIFDFKSRFDSLKQVIDCISLCPRLVSLELGGTWMRRGDFASGTGMRANAQLPPKLRALTLTCDLDYILNWLLQLEDDGPAIEHLQLHHIVQREVPAVAAYLERAGASIESLALLFRDNDAPDRLATKLYLLHAPKLRKLTLEGTGSPTTTQITKSRS